MSVFTAASRRTAGLRTAAVAGAALPALVAGAPLAAADPGGYASAESVPACESHHVKVIENGRHGAAGTIAFELALLHIFDGSGACLMPGSVDVRWIDVDGEQVGSWAVQRGEPGEPFVLDEGESAEFTMYHHRARNHDPQECEPTEVYGIEYFVGPDGEGGRAGMGPGIYVCADTEIEGTSLSPVTPGPHD
ncbi:DUF4232 domain-containing protein [Streptomonospora salina]|uniref:DUF4232 domain-containing protein n=1 Tax=Streptomonospora salina TaxID=104205 RepID=A0A841EFT8_9ACTN|nr:DUF4232 domain-containing protein [Streptomonospora salina]MBB5998281.1 hypothetical protein [Streptomonospora salina]